MYIYIFDTAQANFVKINVIMMGYFIGVQYFTFRPYVCTVGT